MLSIKKTVLAFGEGNDERIFLRYLNKSYCRRDKVSVSVSSGDGGDPTNILNRAIRYRAGLKRDFEFILLDTDKVWPEEMKKLATDEEIKLYGNTPCFEALFLDILESSSSWKGALSGRCKKLFEEEYCERRNFSEDECEKLFPKAVLNSARLRIPSLDEIIKIMEGNF